MAECCPVNDTASPSLTTRLFDSTKETAADSTLEYPLSMDSMDPDSRSPRLEASHTRKVSISMSMQRTSKCETHHQLQRRRLSPSDGSTAAYSPPSDNDDNKYIRKDEIPLILPLTRSKFATVSPSNVRRKQ